MRLWLSTLLGATLLTLAPADEARADKHPDDFRRSMGNLRFDSRTAAQAIEGSSRPDPGTHQGHHYPHRGWYHPHPGYAYPHDCWDTPYGYGYDPYAPYGYPHPYPYYPPYYWVYPYPPPLYLPAETIYGPEAVKRFMGIYPGSSQPPVNVIVVPDKEKPEEADKREPQRATNAESVALGWKFIGFGDAQFVEQQFAQAYVRYKKAAEAAPQLATAHFRQGWALIASGRYELAAAAFKRGLELDPDWPRSDFCLDELYGPNRVAKTAHIDALAAAAGDEPNNAELLFLVGVFLFFDGQPHRAKPFFERAAQMPPGAGIRLGGFLAEVDKGQL